MTQPAFSHLAQTGFAAATAYDQHRPSYPADALEEFLKVLEIKDVKNAVVIDLAAGTGKFTVPLASRPEEYQITAIEPHAEMRAQLEQKLLKRVAVQAGSAENMSQVESETVAAVCVAQAFHWIANMEALKEIHRVLQPTGVLGMIWNIEDYNAPKGWTLRSNWEAKLHEIIWTCEDNQPRFRHEQWRAVFDEQNSVNPLLSDPLFGMPIGEESMDYTIWLSKEDVWNRFRTLSQIAVMEGEELEKVQETFWHAIDSPDTEVDRQGRVALHLRTVFAWASKIPDVPLQSNKAM